MERISALMDGESDRNAVAQAARQMKEHDALREAWNTYHLIGDAMRGENCADTGVSQGFSAKLAAEPTVLAPRRGIGGAMRRMALPSLAAAAAVATVTWVSLETYQGPRNAVPVAEVVVQATIGPIAHVHPDAGVHYVLGNEVRVAGIDLETPAAGGIGIVQHHRNGADNAASLLRAGIEIRVIRMPGPGRLP